MQMNWTPDNIIEYNGTRLKTKDGGHVVARINNVGGSWRIYTTKKNDPKKTGDYSDSFTYAYVAENTDITTACNILNNMEATP